MECSIGRLEGCDQETLDSVTEMPGTTLQDLREMQYTTCGPCSMAVLEGCQQTGQNRDTICRYGSAVGPGTSILKKWGRVQPIFCPKFAENCKNMKKIGPKYNAIEKIPRKNIENKSKMKLTFLHLQTVFESFPCLLMY